MLMILGKGRVYGNLFVTLQRSFPKISIIGL